MTKVETELKSNYGYILKKENFIYYLTFRLDFYKDRTGLREYLLSKECTAVNCNGTLTGDNTTHEIRKYLYHLLGLKIYSYAWTEVELTSTILPKFIKMLEEFKQKKIAYLGSASLSETLNESSVQEAQWFTLNTDSSNQDDQSSFSLDKGYPTCKAYQYSPLLHIQNDYYISENFKNIVKKEKLSGLEFLWVNDKGKYAAKQQWYLTIASKPIGHGLDHPWFDLDVQKEIKVENLLSIYANELGSPTQIKEKILSRIEKKYYGKYRQGISSFDIGAIVSDNIENENIIKLLSFCPKSGYHGNISGHSRYLKKYLPATDFAYQWFEDENYPEDKRRNLCFNKSTKEILLKNKLIKEEQLIPLIIYDELPSGSKDLDINRETPSSLLIEEELLEFKKQEAKLLESYNKKSLPVHTPTIKKSLTLLRQIKRQTETSLVKGTSKKKAEKITFDSKVKLPKSWIDVLVISNGGELQKDEGIDCIILPLEEIDTFNEEHIKYLSDFEDDIKDEYTYFATNVCGDTFAFEKETTKNSDDAKIVLISHEDFSIERKWDGIADFIESIILGL